MAGRGKKTDKQRAYERALGDRLKRIRESAFPDKKVLEGRISLCRLIGVDPQTYEKWEQRGALSAYAAASICEGASVDPYSFLDITRPDALSTEALNFARLYEDCPTDARKHLIDTAALIVRGAIADRKARAVQDDEIPDPID